MSTASVVWTWVFTVAGSHCAVVADENEAGVLGSNSVQRRLHRDTHYVDRDEELHEDMKGKPRTPHVADEEIDERLREY